MEAGTRASRRGAAPPPRLASPVPTTKYLTLGPKLYSMHLFYTGHLVDPQGPFGRMFRKLRIQGRMQIFEKMFQKALNRVLTLDSSGGSDLLQSPLKNMDLQNKNTSVVKKH